MLVAGKPYEVHTDSKTVTYLQIKCKVCSFYSLEDNPNIRVAGPAEAHVMETGHNVEKIRIKEDVSQYRPFTEAEYKVSKKFIDDWYFTGSPCNRNCPGPGTCAWCDAMLDRDLRHDEAMQASLAEWVRANTLLGKEQDTS